MNQQILQKNYPSFLKDALKDNYNNRKPTLAFTTQRSERNKTNQLIKWIGEKQIQEMSQTDWDQFISGLIYKYSARTVNQYMGILNGTLKTAVNNNLIIRNPIDVFITLKVESTIPDPFTRNEISTLMSADGYQFEKSIIKLGVCTGLRISELLAISVEAFDRNSSTLRVDQGLVEGVFVYTKNDVSNREIELSEPALDAMESLIKLSALCDPTTYEFQGVDRKVTIRKRKLLARSSKTNEPFKSVDAFRDSFFKNYCNKVKVRYRGPKNFRHTFACQMLTANAPMEWIISQMGHSNYETLRRHYGMWMPNDASKAYDQAIIELNEMCSPLASVVECNDSKDTFFLQGTEAANGLWGNSKGKKRWSIWNWFKRNKKAS